MKVLFINPLIKKQTQNPLLNSVVFSGPTLGLGHVAAYLRQQQKIPVRIIDEVATPLTDELLNAELDKIKEPLIVGISCLTATYSRAKELAFKIKARKKGTAIIFGGVHPTAVPDESLETGVADIVVRNEGEVTMDELYQALSKGASVETIKGISFKKNGQVIHTPRREQTDLSVLPEFPYDLYDQNIKSYSDFAFMLTSRGCPFDCIFCSNRVVTGKVFRTFSIDYTINQMGKLINKYDQKSIFFGDDNFVADKRRFFELTNEIMNHGFHKKAFFTCQIHGRDMTDEILEQMKEANFKTIFCGMETSSERLMKLVNKRETVEEVKRGLLAAHKWDLLTSTTFIYGLPTETRKERLDSARLSRQLPLDSARFNIAIPYPGTKLFDIAKAEGRLKISPEWRNFNVQYYVFANDIPYVPAGTRLYALIFDTMWANIRFYLRWKVIMTTIFKTDNTGGAVISLQNRRGSLKLYVNFTRIMWMIAGRFIYVFFRFCGERVLGKVQ